MVYPLAAFLRGVERPFLFLEGRFSFQSSLRASSPIWESESRENARASGEAFRFPPPFARAFSRGSLRLAQTGELARRLFPVGTFGSRASTDSQSGGLRFKSFTDL